jgi:hypothetical protein
MGVESSRMVILGKSQPAKNRNLSRLISNLSHRNLSRLISNLRASCAGAPHVCPGAPVPICADSDGPSPPISSQTRLGVPGGGSGADSGLGPPAHHTSRCPGADMHRRRWSQPSLLFPDAPRDPGGRMVK